MKIKPLILGLLILTASTVASLAGPRVSVSINPGWCAPVRPICPPVAYCPPRWYGYPSFSYYPWGSSVFVSSSNGSFTTVSPVMNYANSAPVYQVPAPPILPAQPLVVYPTSPFGWRR